MSTATDYIHFIQKKAQAGTGSGFTPLFMPDTAFDFQQSLIEWSVRMGRAAIFADCGLGKTLMQLAWAENIHLGDQKKNAYSQYIWRQYASSVWMDIRIDRVLKFREAKDGEDEKHVHPLQLDVIERAVVMWSNLGEIVLTPFMGVGSEVYGAAINGRRAIGAELKPSYFKQAAMNLEATEEVVATASPRLFEMEDEEVEEEVTP